MLPFPQTHHPLLQTSYRSCFASNQKCSVHRHPTFWDLSPSGGLQVIASTGREVRPAGLALLDCVLRGKQPTALRGPVFGLIPWAYPLEEGTELGLRLYTHSFL